MSRRFVLDITRLFSRRHFAADTGIDRVERGVFGVLCEEESHGFLVRLGKKYFLFNREGARHILENPRKGKVTTYAQLQRHSIRKGALKLSLSDYEAFYHLGHIRHGDAFWEQLKKDEVKINILIHDVIPLDFPQTCRKDQLIVFKNNFAQWVHYADHVIAPSQYTHDRVLAHARPRAEMVVQPLFVEKLAQPKENETENAFLCISTIEPRKNHFTLLMAWHELHRRLGENCPKLWLIGARGWENQNVFEFLDSSTLMNKFIFELGAVDDKTLQDYFKRSKAVLFPTLAEGFGLPFYEAIVSEQNILASNIPAFNEALTTEDTNELLPPNAVEQWVNQIENFSASNLALKTKLPSNWNEYFILIS